MRHDQRRFPRVLPRDNVRAGTQVPTARSRHHPRTPRSAEEEHPTNNNLTDDNTDPYDGTSDDYSPRRR